jgi:hypothetical protein
VRSLDLTQCRVEEQATLAALKNAPCFSALRHLSLAGNNKLGGALDALAKWGAAKGLAQLALPQSATPADLAALFPEASPALRSLDLASGKALMKALAAVLAAATHFTDLSLGTTSMGDAAFRLLVAAPSCAPLVALKVNGCSLSNKAVTALVESTLSRLVTLDLSSNKLTDDALVALAAWPGLAHVTHLRIGNNRKIGAAGLAALIASPHLDPVELDIGGLGDAKDAPAARGAIRRRAAAQMTPRPSLRRRQRAGTLRASR